MLTLYARAKHKDGGFALWQRMVGQGITIDDFTERMLADLFGDHPQMAATMLKEARRLRLQQSVSCSGVVARAWGLAACCTVWVLADGEEHAGEARAAAHWGSGQGVGSTVYCAACGSEMAGGRLNGSRRRHLSLD